VHLGQAAPSVMRLRRPGISGTVAGRGIKTAKKRRNSPRNSMAAARIDCDIHPAVGGTRTTLLPYLSDHW
jgi:hypothetical protein